MGAARSSALQSDGREESTPETFKCVGPSETARSFEKYKSHTIPHYSSEVAASKSKLDQYDNISKTTFIQSNDVDKDSLKP